MSLSTITSSVSSPRLAETYNALLPLASSLPARGGDAAAAGRPVLARALHPGRASGISLFSLRPPYTDRLALRAPEGSEAEALAFGAIVGIEVWGPVTDWSELERTIVSLRRRWVASPLVLTIDPQAEDLLFVATRVARLPVRAVLFRGEPISDTLRRQVTRPSNLAEDVVEWLGLRGVRLTPVTAHLIRQIFARAPNFHEIVPLLREMGNPESSARFRCRKKRLPSPGRWLHAARALNAAFRIQAEQGRSLLRIAQDLGYADHSALSNQMLRVFRLRPGAVRRILGWEPLLDRWLAAEAGKSRRSPPRDGDGRA